MDVIFPRHPTRRKRKWPRNLLLVKSSILRYLCSILRSFSDQLLSVSSSTFSNSASPAIFSRSSRALPCPNYSPRFRYCLTRHTTCLTLMKHIVKIITLLVTISALWIGLIQMSLVPRSYTWLLPIYLIVSLGCYGLLMVGVGLMRFPTCPQEAVLLQKDISEAKDYLKQKGVDVGSD